MLQTAGINEVCKWFDDVQPAIEVFYAISEPAHQLVITLLHLQNCLSGVLGQYDSNALSMTSAPTFGKMVPRQACSIRQQVLHPVVKILLAVSAFLPTPRGFLTLVEDQLKIALLLAKSVTPLQNLGAPSYHS